MHLRIAGGLLKALDRAEFLGCEAAQLFSSNPNSWATQPIDAEKIGEFSSRCDTLGIYPLVLHTPYLLNLASPDENIWQKSIDSLSHALAKAEAMGAAIVVTHIGSHRGAGLENGIKQIARALSRALEHPGKASIALELGSGSGQTVGANFEEVAMIMDALPDSSRVGVCIDSAHLYAAGYDLSTQSGVESMFEELDTNVGRDKLLVVHLNDTVQELGSKKDRHFHVGKGNVGIQGFRAIVNHPFAANLPGIIETPGADVQFDADNLATLRALSA